MPDHPGIFIVLEGADGSGKTTQFNLLTERLRAVGYDVQIFDFPRYDQASSYFVKKYLNGEYGPASNINPYTASLFYALDRYEAAGGIRKALGEGKVVLSNRYVGSNMAHQGSKFTSEAEQRGFFVWDDSLEYQLLGVPRPNLNIFLRVPAEISYELITRKVQRNYTTRNRDEHEADLGHLQSAVATYDSMCRLFPKDYKAINCVQNGRLLSVLKINERIWQTVKPLVADITPLHSPKATTIRLNKSQKTNQVRPAISTKEGPPEIKKHPLHIKSASLLCWRSIAIYSQSSSSIPRESRQKKTAYYTPVNLPPKILTKYQETMELIYKNQRKIFTSLKDNNLQSKPAAHWALNSLRPMAELSKADYSLSQGSLDKLAKELARGSMIELKEFAKNLPRDFLQVPASGVASKNQTADLFNQMLASLAPDHSISHAPATLNNFQPRAEFELLDDILFEYSGLSKSEIAQSVSSWDYSKKGSVLKNALQNHRFISQAFFEKIRYEWDLLLDGPSLEYLSESGSIEQVEAQRSSPRYGYETPEVIDEAGLDDLFSGCYEASLELYSAMQAVGLEEEAQYVVLYGHRQRYQATTNYLQLKAIWASNLDTLAPASLKPVRNTIFELVGTTHPLIAASITAGVSPKIYKKLNQGPANNTNIASGKKVAGSRKKTPRKTRRNSK